MAVIMVPVEAMDERCAGCQCMDLDKETLYGGGDQAAVMYSCRNIHMCQYIRNRIVRKEEKAVKESEESKNE